MVAAIVAVIAIVVIIISAYLSRRMKGSISIVLNYEENNQEAGTIGSKEYAIDQDIRLASLGAYGFTASHLLKAFGKFYRNSVLDSGDYDSVEREALEKLKQVTFKPVSKGHSFQVKKKKGKEIVFLGESYEESSQNVKKIAIK